MVCGGLTGRPIESNVSITVPVPLAFTATSYSGKVEITAAPADPEYPARFAAGGSGGEQWGDAVAFFVRDCDGSIELYVYSEDGMRPIESRLLLREPEPVSTARLALADGGGG